MKTVLIAGGTGYIGQHLENHLTLKGYDVKILTRTPKNDNHILWDPTKNIIDKTKCTNIQVIINLCGEGINNRRWTKKQRQKLIHSRIDITKSLHNQVESFPKLEHYISASGITAYGFDDGLIEHTEESPYGLDFLSNLVKNWENAADYFTNKAIVSKLRIAVVLEWRQGALKQMSKTIGLGIGSPIGSGKQQMPWVHISDLVKLFEFVIANKLEGTYNTNANNSSNEELTKAIAKKMNKRLWLPNVPKVIIQMALGKMSEMVLNGAKASNKKIKSAGFQFSKPQLDDVLS